MWHVDAPASVEGCELELGGGGVEGSGFGVEGLEFGGEGFGVRTIGCVRGGEGIP